MSNQEVLKGLESVNSELNSLKGKGDSFCNECVEEAAETTSECQEEVREHI